MRDINIQIDANGNQPGDAFNMAMCHLCNLAIYKHLLSLYGLWVIMTWIESTIFHTQGEQTSH